MTLERAIALLFLVLCIAYGYSAFVTMQENLLPFELNMVFLPNTMPKVLSVVGVLVALIIIFSPGASGESSPGQLDFSRLKWEHITQAVLLLVAMTAYALLLRPLGFIASTTLFIAGSSILLGERRILLLLAISIVASLSIWYLVEELLDIVLKPLPWFIEP
ncbi:MAG: tripartite tricarboxylate transporter TctB family protein [Hyphomicrobiaceae bacterium]